MLQRSAIAAFFILVLGVCFPATAQVQRVFPQNALRGALVIGNPPEVTLNGKPARLAPGVRIRDQANMITMSGGLVGARLLVNYTLDTTDLVSDVWVLRPEEASRRPWPTTRKQAQDWVFDPVAQTWSRS